MSEPREFKIRLASREWSRQFSNVVRSFAKTVTEAVTNSDTSYKRKFKISDSSGLVELILTQGLGTKLNSADLKKRIAGKTPKREIQIHLYTARGYGKEPRTCEIVDFAEGLSADKLFLAFEEFAADKSAVSEGRPGRSLFGRGISDVLLGHKGGEFFSYKDGVLNRAIFKFDMTKSGEPWCKIEKVVSLKKKMDSIHLDMESNGSCIQVILHDDCSIPEEASILPLLSQFYMMRLINSDPNVRVRVFRNRARGQVFEDDLHYDFPIGDIIAKFSFDFPIPVKIVGTTLPPLKVDGIVCRADTESMKGKESKDTRENGLLIMDDKDAVLDLTLLPDFESAPYLNRIYGLIRLTGIRDVFDHLLNRGKESALSTTRDGFDVRHEFTQALFKKLREHLEPVYRKEEERYKKTVPTELSDETKKRIQEALKHLNKYLADLMGEGEADEPDLKNWEDVPVQFYPQKTRLVTGVPKRVLVVLRSKDVKNKAYVLLDSDNSKMIIDPTTFQIEKIKAREGFIEQTILLKCDDLHEKAKITAIVEGESEIFEASMIVEDVVSTLVIEPPENMEFRPKESRGLPNRKNNLTLYINSTVIPVGRKITFRILKKVGSIGFIDNDNKRCDQCDIKFEKNHIIDGSITGRMLVPWQGDGLGQTAQVIAETKTPDGETISSNAKIIIKQPEVKGGIIEKVLYDEVDSSMCSTFAGGIIYINSLHSMNREVFGKDQSAYDEKVKTDYTAQYRLSTIMVEQGVFQLGEKTYLDGKLRIDPGAPITSMRQFVDERTNELAPKIFRVLLKKIV